MFIRNIQSLFGFNNSQKHFVCNTMNEFKSAMNYGLLKEKVTDFTCTPGKRFKDN